VFNFVKNIFRKNKENTPVASEYDKEAFLRFGEKERSFLLKHFSEMKKEHDLRSMN